MKSIVIFKKLSTFIEIYASFSFRYPKFMERLKHMLREQEWHFYRYYSSNAIMVSIEISFKHQ